MVYLKFRSRSPEAFKLVKTCMVRRWDELAAPEGEEYSGEGFYLGDWDVKLVDEGDIVCYTTSRGNKWCVIKNPDGTVELEYNGSRDGFQSMTVLSECDDVKNLYARDAITFDPDEGVARVKKGVKEGIVVNTKNREFFFELEEYATIFASIDPYCCETKQTITLFIYTHKLSTIRTVKFSHYFLLIPGSL